MEAFWAAVPVWIKWVVAACVLFSVWFTAALFFLARRLGQVRPYRIYERTGRK